MKIFFRLLSFFGRYRYRLLAGIFVSLVAALLNGISFGALLPIFESLGSREREFSIHFSQREQRLLQNALKESGIEENIPPVGQKIDRQSAQNLLRHLQTYLLQDAKFRDDNPQDDNFQGTDLQKADFQGARQESWGEIERLQLETIIQWKLKLNAAGYSPLQVTIFTCIFILPIYFLKILLVLVCLKLITNTGYMAVRDIRDQLYRKLQNLPLIWFYRKKGGELVSRMVNDAEVISPVISTNMRDSIINIFYLAVYAVILAYLNFKLLLIILIAAPLILPSFLYLMRKIRRAVGKSQELMANLHGHLQEAISGMRIIRLAAMEEYEKSRFHHINQRLYWRTFKEFFYLRMNPNLVEFNAVILVLGIVFLAIYYFDSADFAGSEFLTFTAILAASITPIIQLSRMYGNLQGALAASHRIFYILDQPVEIVQPKKPLPLKHLEHSIVFENVHFSYPETEKEVLQDINLEVKAGTTVALVGESGAGKSTLMDLLARFFRPTKGRILLDGADILDFTVQDHRSRLGIVSQDIFLFYGTVYGNIAYGSPQHSRKEVEKAARLAYAHDFIKEMDNGYDTLIGNRGLYLSGGQRQKIAIARALLRDPEILILDEATSSLDSENERQIQNALERLFRNRTIFVIAHRLSTIEKADLIVTISKGRIVEQGSHSELIQQDSIYAQLQKLGPTRIETEQFIFAKKES